MFRLAARWIAVSVLLVGVLGGRAQAMQLTPVQKQEMKQHYEKATRAYDVQKYSEAVDEYQRAYEIGGDPAMLYNVAQSYRLNDQPADALRFYRRYLQRSPNARNRDDVEKKIADLERVVEERRRKAAAAPPPPPAPIPVVIAQAPPPEAPVKQVEASPGRRIAGIVIASVGAVALATAAITGKMASDKAAKLSDASKVGDVFDPNLEKNGKTLNNIAIVSGIVGGAAIVTGVVLILTSRGSSSPERQAMVSPMVGGGGLVGATALVQF
jgi:tetratricopeptide (TPR) repeat protein